MTRANNQRHDSGAEASRGASRGASAHRPVAAAVLKPLVAVAVVLAAATFYFGLPQSAGAGQTDAPKASVTKLKVTEIATGLANPWGLQFLPDGRMLVTERPGRIRIVDAAGKLSPPVAGVPKVHARGQGGLLDIRLAPDFATTGTVFFSFSEPREGGKSATAVARARLMLADGTDGGKLEDLRIIFRQQPAQPTSHHYGSRIVPRADGTLFVTTGDRGIGNLAQDTAATIGKVIRITADGGVPADNPKQPGWAPEVWSMGHRNIQGAAIDSASGRLWTVEHGARGGDELNRPEAGKNYGWPVISYGRNYNLSKIGVGTGKEGMEQPVYFWDPSIATSGLAIYDGGLFPDWKGNLLVGGLAGAQVSRLVVENGAIAAEEVLLEDRGDRIRDVRVGPDGAVYLLVDEGNGAILKLTPAGR
ncbi:MAG: PQQ-dependent sugar dehydrogenase [Hyphomicrobiaceae bacterium]|nr:PQQ-dependent sugar dehydrogenase [Hyphomicrobiaceae bacterium]